MATEKVGLQAVLDDKNFNDGLKRFQSGINAATAAAEKGAHAITAVGKAMGGAFIAGIGAATVAVGAFSAVAKIGVDAALAQGEALDKLGDMFGLSAKQADIWAATFTRFGVPVEEAAQQINFFTRGLAETVKVGKDGKTTLTPFGEALQKIGIKATDAKGKLKTFDQIMPQIMDAFEKLPPGVNKSALAMELFGARGGSKFLDFLSAGSGALKDATKRVNEFGTMTDKQRDEIEDFGFALNVANDSLKRIWTQIGLAVLPYLRRLVDYIQTKVLPVFSKWVKENLPKLIAAFDNFVRVIQRDVLPFIQRLVDAFKKGGIEGLFARLATEIQNALPLIQAALAPLVTRFWDWLTGKGGALEQAGEKLGQIATKIQDWLKANSPAIIAKFDELKTAFWNWLTGENGALSQAASKLGEFKTAIEKWLKDNAPIWTSMFKSWIESFWNWLTDPKSGVISLLADNLGKLTININKWANEPSTKKEYKKVGKDLATWVINGIGNLFSNEGEGNALLQLLWRNLWIADQNLKSAFMSIGNSIASGIWEGIITYFSRADVQERLRVALYNAIVAMIPGLRRDINLLIASLFGGTPPAPKPIGGGGGGTGGDRHGGGYIPKTASYNLLAGEYVLSPKQVRLLAPVLTGGSPTNNYTFNHTWNGGAPSNAANIERMVEDATYRAMTRVVRDA